MGETSIEWTDATWNPVRGCSRVSEGCRNCYAETFAARDLPGHRSPTTGEPFARRTPAGPRWTGRVELIPSKLADPLHWIRPRRVFVNSMSDLFHESLSDEAIAAVFGGMAAAPQHTFQVLTKRADRLPRWFAWYEADRNRKRFRHPELIEHAAATVAERALRSSPVEHRRVADHLFKAANAAAGRDVWPLPNVWLGVSVEDQATADERIPHLLQTPAAVRWVSYEPALGPVDFARWLCPTHWSWDARFSTPEAAIAAGARAERKRQALVSADARFLDWIVVGGESGPGARPFDVAWARSTVEQCKAAGVPVFVKQLGSRCRMSRTDAVIPVAFGGAGWDADSPGAEHGVVRQHANGKGGDPLTWPEDLRVREMPGGAA